MAPPLGRKPPAGRTQRARARGDPELGRLAPIHRCARAGQAPLVGLGHEDPAPRPAFRPETWHDPHWSSQVDLAGVEELDYRVVGRMEDLGAVLSVVDGHLRRHGRAPLVLGAENASLLPFTRGALDAETAAASADWAARDRTVLGYPPVPAGDLDGEWVAAVPAALRAIDAVAARNERIGDLRDLIRRSRAS